MEERHCEVSQWKNSTMIDCLAVVVIINSMDVRTFGSCQLLIAKENVSGWLWLFDCWLMIRPLARGSTRANSRGRNVECSRENAWKKTDSIVKCKYSVHKRVYSKHGLPGTRYRMSIS